MSNVTKNQFRIDYLDLQEGDAEWMTQKFEIDESDGFLKGRAIVTNVGVFTYVLADGSIRRELRPPEEVLDSLESRQSLAMRPITNGHPENMVTSENVDQVKVGFTGEDIRRDGYHL